MKLTLETRVDESIPLIEYKRDNYPYKGLVFIQHGYESTKEYGSDYLALDLARRGFFVVAIDAYKHGERILEPYVTGTAEDRLNEAFVVVKRTALDIIRLHHNQYKEFPTFDFIGVSLGGMVGYYLATKTNRLGKLVPVISTPDFQHQAYHAVGAAGLDTATFFTPEKLDFIASLNPLNRLDKMAFQSLFALVGDRDEVVPKGPTEAFFEAHGDKRMRLASFDVGHSVSRPMQLAIFDYIDQ